MKKSKTGTREWAEYNRNIQLGCENDCRYCYAREMAVRFKRCTVETWKDIKLSIPSYHEKPRKLNGRIMFPTTHDITKKNIGYVIVYLEDWLKAGNEILIVSKPDPDCIEAVCDRLKPYRDQITFRFTIGSTQNDTLKFWEPNAPCFEDRLKALKIAHAAGYKTSVSCEPFLDTISDVTELVKEVEPYVTDSIWIGKMNQIKKRVVIDYQSTRDLAFLGTVNISQTDDSIRVLYEHLKSNPLVRWKDSIKKVIGLDEEAIG